jgi:hypothetical protein
MEGNSLLQRRGKIGRVEEERTITKKGRGT